MVTVLSKDEWLQQLHHPNVIIKEVEAPVAKATETKKGTAKKADKNKEVE